jgi:hypothetical protein
VAVVAAAAVIERPPITQGGPAYRASRFLGEPRLSERSETPRCADPAAPVAAPQ